MVHSFFSSDCFTFYCTSQNICHCINTHAKIVSRLMKNKKICFSFLKSCLDVQSWIISIVMSTAISANYMGALSANTQ